MSRPSLHIALVCRHYPPEVVVGGIATYTSILARTLAALGHDVSVICEGEPSIGQDQGVRLVRTVPHNAKWLSRRPLGWLKLYARLHYLADWFSWSQAVYFAARRIQKEWGLDIVEAPDFMAQGWTCATTQHYPTVVKLHGPAQLVLPLNGIKATWTFRLAAPLERQAARRADVVTSPSFAMAEWARTHWQIGSDRLMVLPNAIDESLFKPAGSGTHSSNQKNILFVGRIEQNKGVLVLLEAFKAVTKRVPQATLQLAGSGNWHRNGRNGPVSDLLEASLASTNLISKVSWLGALPRAALVPLYQNSAVCVFPSLSFDNFPYTCLEAMACGRPVVGTTSGGMAEMIEDGVSGYLVAPGDAKGLAQRLADLLENPNQSVKVGQAARKRAETNYSRSAMVERTLGVYRQIIEAKISCRS